MKLLLFTAALLFTFSSAIAQPPPAAPSGGARVLTSQPSVAGLKPEDHFSSLEGRFTIALPKQISGFAGLTKEDIGYDGSGRQFTWRLKEGMAIVRYTHYLDRSLGLETETDITKFQNGFRDGFLSASSSMVLRSEKRGKLGSHDELTLLVTRADGSEVHIRSIVAGRSHYGIIYIPNSAAGETLLRSAVSTFKVLSQESVNLELQKRIEAATPKPLPQTPAIARETTDAQDEGFKGKVHQVVVTSQNADEPAPKPSSITDFDERGNFVKRFLYNGGKPFQITQYGFIDGKRVSDSGLITYESDPPPMASIGSSEGEARRDDRYQYSYTYKYADGKLIERQLFLNTGKPGNRSVYETRGNTRERRVYTEDGKLNQRYLDVMNDQGLDVEQTNFDLTDKKYYGDRKYRMTYDEFDKQGNWTKRTTLKAVVKDGKEIFEPAWTTFRKITYFQS